MNITYLADIGETAVYKIYTFAGVSVQCNVDSFCVAILIV